MSELILLLQEEWTCPISNTEMIDPVITTDGHTYERSAIELWFRQSQKSPKTNLRLQYKELIPNLVLKSIKEKVANQLSKQLTKLSLQLKELSLVRDENTSLKKQIFELSEQIGYLKKIYAEECQIHRKLRMQKKIDDEILQIKLNQLHLSRCQEDKLKDNIETLKRQQTLMKAQLTQCKEKIENQKTQIQSQKQTFHHQLHRKIEENREEMKTILQYRKLFADYCQKNYEEKRKILLLVDCFRFILSVMISEIYHIVREGRKQQTKRLIDKLFKRIQSQLQQNSLNDDQYPNCATEFQIHHYFIKKADFQRGERIDLFSISKIPNNDKSISYIFNSNQLASHLLKSRPKRFKIGRLNKMILSRIGFLEVLTQQEWKMQFLNSPTPLRISPFCSSMSMKHKKYVCTSQKMN